MAKADKSKQTASKSLSESAVPPTCPVLPMIDDETLDTFLQEPAKVQRLPVTPSGYRREFQRMIVSAFLYEASGAEMQQAKG